MKLGAKTAQAPADTPTPDSAIMNGADDSTNNLFGANANPEQAPSDDKPFDDEPFNAGVEADEDSDPKKYIEQLTGKLGQSLRKYEDEQGSPDFELEKFAINSLLSATHTAEMNPEDQKDIIKKVKSSGKGDDDAEMAADTEEPTDTPDETQDQAPEETGDDLDNLFEGVSVHNPQQALIDKFNNGDELDKNILSRWFAYEDEVSPKEFADIIENEWEDDNEKCIKGLELLDQVKAEINSAGQKLNVSEADFMLQNPPKNNMFQEGSNDILDEMKPCWKGYKQVGMKTKDGKEVPNCVPVNEAIVKRLHKMVNDLKLSENNCIFAQNEDMIEPATKPEVKPQTKPATTPEPKPLRKNKPFLPNVTPGTKTQPKAVSE